MSEMRDTTTSSVATIRSLAPANGVYFSPRGSLMAVRLADDGADSSAAGVMAARLARQVLANAAVAAVLCLLVAFLADRSPSGIATAFALAGFAIISLREVSMSIWYGFTAAWSAVNVVDHTIGFGLCGLAIGVAMRRLAAEDVVALPEGQGYRISGKRTTVAR